MNPIEPVSRKSKGDTMRFDFANAEPVRRGRKPAEVPAHVAQAVAILATDEGKLPLAWRKNRSRKTYQLPNGNRVALWVRKDAKSYRPGNEWVMVRDNVFIPDTEATK